MNSSPRPVRRFSRWQTRKHTFVLEGTTFTTGSSINKAASRHRSSTGDHVKNGGRTADLPAGTDQVLNDSLEKTALADVSQNPILNSDTQKVQTNVLKETHEKSLNRSRSHLDNELEIVTKATVVDAGEDNGTKIVDSHNDNAKRSLNETSKDSSYSQAYEKENDKSIIKSATVAPNTVEKDGKFGLSSSFYSETVHGNNRGRQVLSTQKENKKTETDKSISISLDLSVPIDNNDDTNQHEIVAEDSEMRSNVKMKKNQLSLSHKNGTINRSARELQNSLAEKRDDVILSTTNSPLTIPPSVVSGNENANTDSFQRETHSSLKSTSLSSKKMPGKSVLSKIPISSSSEVDEEAKEKTPHTKKSFKVTENPNISLSETEKNMTVSNEQEETENPSLSFIDLADSSSKARSLRNRSTLKKTPAIQYPIEFLGSPQVKSLSTKAKRILLNTSVTSHDSNEISHAQLKSTNTTKTTSSDLMTDQDQSSKIINEDRTRIRSEINTTHSSKNQPSSKKSLLSGNTSINIEHIDPPSTCSTDENADHSRLLDCSSHAKTKPSMSNDVTSSPTEVQDRKSNEASAVARSKQLKPPYNSSSVNELNLNESNTKCKTTTKRGKTKSKSIRKDDSANFCNSFGENLNSKSKSNIEAKFVEKEKTSAVSIEEDKGSPTSLSVSSIKETNTKLSKKLSSSFTGKKLPQSKGHSEKGKANAESIREDHESSIGLSNSSKKKEYPIHGTESSSCERSLRNRNSLSKSTAVQYPMEFLSSNQMKSLSSKAKQILMNTSISKSSASINNQNQTIEKCSYEETIDDKNKHSKKLSSPLKRKKLSLSKGQPKQSLQQQQCGKDSMKTKQKIAIRRRQYSVPRKKPKKQFENPVFESTEITANSIDSISQSLVLVDNSKMNISKDSRKDGRDVCPVNKTVQTSESNDVWKQSQELNDTICGVLKTGCKRKLFVKSGTERKISRPGHAVNTQKSHSNTEGVSHHATADNFNTNNIEPTSDNSRNNPKARPKKVTKKPANVKSTKNQRIEDSVVIGSSKADTGKEQTFESRLKTSSTHLEKNEDLINEWMSAYRHLIDQLDSRDS